MDAPPRRGVRYLGEWRGLFVAPRGRPGYGGARDTRRVRPWGFGRPEGAASGPRAPRAKLQIRRFGGWQGYKDAAGGRALGVRGGRGKFEGGKSADWRGREG